MAVLPADGSVQSACSAHRGGVRSSRAGVTDACEPLDDAGN